MGSLLEQLRSDLPDNAHRRRVFIPDLTEAERIAKQARELNLKSIRYILTLDKFEERPPEGDPKRAVYDLLLAALGDVSARLAGMKPVERSTEKSED